MAAYLSVTPTTGGLICTVSGLDSSYSYERYFVWQASLNGVLAANDTTTEQKYISSTSHTLTGLTGGSLYTVKVGIYTTGWELIATLESSGTPLSYTVSATVVFNSNGGSPTPSSVSATAPSTEHTGYVSITFPDTVPMKNGYSFDYWVLSSGTTTYSTLYYPGQTYQLYGSINNGITYTATAHWMEATNNKIYIYIDGVWKPVTPYIYTDQGWKLVTPYIYTDQGWK